jgi:hypothetical protein
LHRTPISGPVRTPVAESWVANAAKGRQRRCA